MQLDIFDHGREVHLRNDAAAAVLRNDPAAARAACAVLAAEYPRDDALAPLAVLVDAIGQRTDAAFTDHARADAARRRMADAVEPAARAVLGEADARPWLAALWGELAARAGRLAFDPRHADSHAAPLWLRARRWDEAAAAVERIPSWRRIPAPLAWMAHARYHLQDLDGTWELLAGLAWMAPPRLDDLMQALGDPVLRKLRDKFDAGFDAGGGGEDLAWFPAWLLTEKPVLAPHLARAQRGACTPPEQAMRLLLELLGLERQGRHHDVVRQRKALRDASPQLWAAYMATR